jgi:hypothetical protein
MESEGSLSCHRSPPLDPETKSVTYRYVDETKQFEKLQESFSLTSIPRERWNPYNFLAVFVILPIMTVKFDLLHSRQLRDF